MKNAFAAVMAFLISLTLVLGAGRTDVLGARIKDIASLKGARANELIGYGLVVGLNGTGDGTGTKFTVQTLVNMLERLGIHALPSQVKVANVAAVMVTAHLQPFARIGNKLDVLISSLGDAKSLQGGTLLLTMLKGVDNQVYALAQGPILVGGFSASGEAGGGVKKNHPTVGRIPGGAMVEKEIPFDFNSMEDLVIALHQPDFTTAQRISQAVNKSMAGISAVASDAGTVRVNMRDGKRGNLVNLVSALEQIDVQTDSRARIILDERTGTVVLGENVRISSVAIAHGNLSVQIKERKDVSQPLPFSEGGQTVVTNDSQVNVTEDQNKLLHLPETASLGDVVKALNAIGVSPRDLIAVFQAIKASGALHAELEII
ncbi:MAG: flagellar biosynthesis protein FlgA [Deltaproteobacteria bacterium HGW-Deltaproteobacteria-15]|jgi:flagellar P-ring protein precursor FlgI|nr:MAG: flagellar biosynthesis protein FlgA [Deltaproteobacteria bacterium HGW-Deltaproteobacteria-15]